MRPTEVLDMQADLIERCDNPAFAQYVDGWASADIAGGTPDELQNVTPILKNHARAAYAYNVTRDMSTLIEHAAADLDELDRFDRDLAPTGCGFVVFDRPLPVLDARGKTMLIHTYVWGPIAMQGLDSRMHQTVTGIWAFNDTWREPDQVALEHVETSRARYTPEVIEKFNHVTGRWAGVGLTPGWHEQRLGPKLLTPGERVAERIRNDGLEPVAGTNTLRYVHALWLLLNQTVTRVEDEYPDRAGRRRAVRKGLPPKVTVIALRRREQAEHADGESEVEWQHRWIVRSHWAWRHCGPNKPGAVPYKGGWGVRVWVNAYLKGPEDAPLKQSEKVYQLKR